MGLYQVAYKFEISPTSDYIGMMLSMMPSIFKIYICKSYL